MVKYSKHNMNLSGLNTGVHKSRVPQYPGKQILYDLIFSAQLL